MLQIMAQFTKELLQLRRDRLSIILILCLPAMLMLLLGTAVSLKVNNIPIVIEDLDQSPLSQRYSDSVRDAITFHVISIRTDVEPEAALRAGAARAAIVIPEHFERNIRRGEVAHIQMLIDATDANTANVLRGSVDGLTRAFAQSVGIRAGYANRTGSDEIPAFRSSGAPGSELGSGFLAPSREGSVSASVQAPVDLRTRLWFNPGTDFQRFIVPGALAVCASLLPPILAALSAAGERESGTLLQIYVSGVSAERYLLGKIAAFTLVAATVWVLLMAIAELAFGLRLAGSRVPFAVNTVLFLVAVISFGTMIGSITPNKATAMQGMQIGSFMLAFLLSGFIFPLSNVPMQIRWLSTLTPARYYIEVVRDSFISGGGWAAQWSDTVALALLTISFFTLTWLRMRRMQGQA